MDATGAGEFVPVSALQHLLFCERQCALIHVEQIWIDNSLTVEGHRYHENVDERGSNERSDIRTMRSVSLVNTRLGLTGRADVVEFHRVTGNNALAAGVPLHNLEGRWRPYPVEYKRGRPKKDPSDAVQLCAQALCLEEMFGVTIEEGALFYWRTRRRTGVQIDQDLRDLTLRSIERLHALLGGEVTPKARREPKCASCSFLEACLPDGIQRSALQYLNQAMSAAESPE